MKRLPILMYHNIAARPSGGQPGMFVNPHKFDKQMKLLSRLGYQGVSLEKAMSFDRKKGRPLAITFDDGYKDNLENALPILVRYGFTATCFVVTSLLGRYNDWRIRNTVPKCSLMSVSDLHEWQSAGMEVGAHSRTHKRLTGLSDHDLRNEVKGSKQELEDILHVEVKYFSYPFGNYDTKCRAVVTSAGFKGAVTATMRRTGPLLDIYALSRIGVMEHSSLLLRLVANGIPDVLFRRIFPSKAMN